MKIRTDFVTNSSSYSSAEVLIENLVLLEILQKYKDMGVFGDADPGFSIGSFGRAFYPFEYEDLFSYDIYKMHRWDFIRETKTPALLWAIDFVEDPDEPLPGTPGSLDEVLQNIIEVMNWGDVMNGGNSVENYDKDLYEQMKLELHQRKGEIIDGYKKVCWKNEYLTEGPSEGDTNKCEFTYDPLNGEKYNIEFYGIDDNDD